VATSCLSLCHECVSEREGKGRERERGLKERGREREMKERGREREMRDRMGRGKREREKKI
jgi:hypothetical protein